MRNLQNGEQDATLYSMPMLDNDDLCPVS